MERYENSLPVFLFGKQGWPLTTEYPFIKYIPIGDAMSKSYLSSCAMTCRMKQPDCT